MRIKLKKGQRIPWLGAIRANIDPEFKESDFYGICEGMEVDLPDEIAEKFLPWCDRVEIENEKIKE